jgi:hypothetical protein
MNKTVKNILIVIAAVIAGSVVNMGIIMMGSSIIPPPTGVDPNDLESIKANIDLYEWKHFMVPFLAHALGSLVGGLIAGKFIEGKKGFWVGLVAGLFLGGGVTAATMIPAPTWFVVLDLVVAYIPMAWLGSKLVKES